jgi:hypothetical protein
MSQDRMLDAALAYAKWGWPVFPLAPGTKEPLSGSHGFYDASTDQGTIRKLWAESPGANVGLRTGDLVAIDLDVKNGKNGPEVWHDLKEQHGFSDDTITSLTPHGGQHLLYAANGHKISGGRDKLGPGIDVKAQGGLVVLPPSRLKDGGEYVWDVGAHPADREPAPLPDALAKLLLNGKDREKKPIAVVGGIPEGARNDTLTSMAGAMRRKGFGEEAILAALLIENGDRCQPPLPGRDLATIAASIARYEPEQITLQPIPPGMESPSSTPVVKSGPPDLRELADCPPLPEGVQPDPELGAGAGTLVDLYTDHAQAISPMTPRIFHESAALWLGAVAIARRLRLAMPFGDVYPNLFIHWMAYTTLFRKSTALGVPRKLARTVFPHLMTAQDTTPEAFLGDLAGREPPYFDKLTDKDRDDWTAGRNYAAQKGWLLDEMSGLLAGAGREYNAGLVESLLRFYDCEPYFARSTRGQGRVIVRDSYLSLLGASTPAAMMPHFTAERLWANGWWPRFAILTPDTTRPTWRNAEWGSDGKQQSAPAELFQALQQVCERLPAATWPEPPKTKTAILGVGAFEAWEQYNKALSYDLLTEDLDHRLHGTYGRLPVQALKVSLILAALDGWPKHHEAPTVELRHMARGVATSEAWRASAHRALAIVTRTEFDQMRVRILRQVGKAGPDGVTFRDLTRGMRDKQPNEIEDTLRQMIKAREVEWEKSQGKGRPTVFYKISAH